MPKVISLKKVHELTGLNMLYIRRLCRNGALPASKVAGTWVVATADFEAFMVRRATGRYAVQFDDDTYEYEP